VNFRKHPIFGNVRKHPIFAVCMYIYLKYGVFWLILAKNWQYSRLGVANYFLLLYSANTRFLSCYDHKNYFLLLYSANTRQFWWMWWSQKFGLL
jgi:hypothetical protein